MFQRMNTKIAAGLLLIISATAHPAGVSEDFGSSAETVGPATNRLAANRVVTPVNQIVTPAGRQIDLPGLWPHALALSPDRRLLVIAGRTHELTVLDPGTGNILQRVSLPSAQAHTEPSLMTQSSDADVQGLLSFTGLAFSPDGSRIYCSNVKGDIKVFAVAEDQVSFHRCFPSRCRRPMRPDAKWKFPRASRFRRTGKKSMSR